MQFNSWQYAVFLVVVFAAHWLLKARYRWFFLLLASYFFYMRWNPAYAVLILLTTVVSYYAALGIDRRPQRKKQIAAVTALICLGVLGVFKYFNFFVSAVRFLLIRPSRHAEAPAPGGDLVLYVPDAQLRS